jgi:hypothetical protein
VHLGDTRDLIDVGRRARQSRFRRRVGERQAVDHRDHIGGRHAERVEAVGDLRGFGALLAPHVGAELVDDTAADDHREGEQHAPQRKRQATMADDERGERAQHGFSDQWRGAVCLRRTLTAYVSVGAALGVGASRAG